MDLELNGAKFGCGLAQCGACTVLVNGQAVRSCVTPIDSLQGADDRQALVEASLAQTEGALANFSATEGTVAPDVQRTLNWVHLATRFPVRVRIIAPESEPFRLSESAVVIIRGWK